jgi:hypothetical protein
MRFPAHYVIHEGGTVPMLRILTGSSRLAHVNARVEDTARKNNYTLVICNHVDYAEKEAEYCRSLLSLKVDGCLLIPSGDKAKKAMRLLTDHRCPVVLIDRHPSAYLGDCFLLQKAADTDRHNRSSGQPDDQILYDGN